MQEAKEKRCGNHTPVGGTDAGDRPTEQVADGERSEEHFRVRARQEQQPRPRDALLNPFFPQKTRCVKTYRRASDGGRAQ